MKYSIFLPILFLTNCIQTNDSNFINKNLFNDNQNQKKLIDLEKKLSYTVEMSFNDFKFYIDDYVKKSKYPNINK